MTTIDERMAEINRRSENILKRRKQRRQHILMTCIPLVLLVGLCAIVLKPESVPNQTVLPSTGESVTANTADTSCEGLVEVSGAGISLRLQESDDVERITGLIDRVTEAHAPDRNNGWSWVDPADTDVKGKDALDVPVTIRITDANAVAREYVLTQTALVNRDSGESFTITQKEYRTLMAALGILIS